MADQGSRQDRRDASQPRLGPVDMLSADQHGYVDGVPVLQERAAADPAYNGMDAERRLGGDGG
ncbi:MAG TPA: hypothetical protein VGJ59_22190 [Jatrophihabitantaceae bacterium]|jgi:hypothetical protein